jgi:hypothetical protein
MVLFLKPFRELVERKPEQFKCDVYMYGGFNFRSVSQHFTKGFPDWVTTANIYYFDRRTLLGDDDIIYEKEALDVIRNSTKATANVFDFIKQEWNKHIVNDCVASIVSKANKFPQLAHFTHNMLATALLAKLQRDINIIRSINDNPGQVCCADQLVAAFIVTKEPKGAKYVEFKEVGPDENPVWIPSHQSQSRILIPNVLPSISKKEIARLMVESMT